MCWEIHRAIGNVFVTVTRHHLQSAAALMGMQKVGYHLLLPAAPGLVCPDSCSACCSPSLQALLFRGKEGLYLTSKPVQSFLYSVFLSTHKGYVDSLEGVAASFVLPITFCTINLLAFTFINNLADLASLPCKLLDTAFYYFQLSNCNTYFILP